MADNSEQITRRIFDTSIPTFYSRTDNLYALLKSFAEEYGILYENIEGLIRVIDVDKATGSFLNDLGKLFNLSRGEDETDEQYRAKVKSYWSVLSGGGTPEGIKAAIVLLIGVDIDDVIIMSADLIISVEIQITDNTNVASLNDVANVINLAKPAGVYYNNRVEITSKNNIFTTNLSSVNGPDTLL